MTTTSEIITNFEAEQKNVVFSALSEYLSTGLFVDVSLVCKGQVLRAHKVVLSSSSKYFRDFFRHQPNVSIIDLDKELEPNDLNLTLEDIKLIIGILYCVGTVEISPLRIESLLVCAQVLGIPTLILFLKRIRESINETKIVKDGQLLYYGGKLLGPSTSRFDLTNVSPRHSAHRRPSGGEMMYILSSPTRQVFPPPPDSVPQSFPLNPPPPPPNPPPPLVQHGGHGVGDDRRSAATRQGVFPLLDLSLVKPMTASCVNSPESPHENNSSSWMPSGTPSPVPGPSGINTRNLQQQQQPSGGTLLTATSSSCGSDSTTPPQPGPSTRGGGVTDSMLTHQSKQRPLLNMHRQSVSRISNTSYSSLTLNCLQSPQRTTTTADLSTDNLLHHHNQPRRMNSVSMLDGIDPNLLMQLNNLPANQLDDLENVLLPHLTSDGRSCQPSPNGDHLLDLPGMDINDSDHNNGSKDGNHHLNNEINKSHNNLPITPSQTSTTLTSTLSMSASNAPTVSQFHSFSMLPSLSGVPTNIRAASAESNPDPFARTLGFSGRIFSSTPACLDLSRPHDGQFIAPTERPFRPPSQATSNQSGHTNDFLNISSHSLSRTDISTRARSPKRARIVSQPSAEPVPSLTPGVRLTPFTIYDQSMNKPVRLTPMGSVVLAPLNNLLAPSAKQLPSASSQNMYTPVNNLINVNSTRTISNETTSNETETDGSSVKQSGLLNNNQDNNTQMPADLSNLSTDHDNNEQEPLNESLADAANNDEVINAENIKESNINHISNQESNVGPSNNQESTMKTRSTNSEIEKSNNQTDQVMPQHSQAPTTMSIAQVVSSQSIPGCSFQQAAQPSGEIIMNLDQVCPTGQRMKFSVPGVSQAVTLNFSAEALQEMKNAALRTTRATLPPEQVAAGAAIAAAPMASTAPQDHTANELIDHSNQSEEISSSRANFDNDDLICEDEPCSNVVPQAEQDVNDNENDSSEQQELLVTRTESPTNKKQKKSRKNLRQKLKSNRATRKAKTSDHSAEVKYSCTVCAKSFALEQQLIKHLRFHVKKIFTCELCCKVFDDRWKYDKHMEEVHDKKEANKCPECAKIFYQATELMAHIQTCHPETKSLECKICHLSFNRKHQLIKHVTTWHPNSNLPLCQICMELFEDKNEQEQHECSGAQVQSNKIVCHKHPTPMEFANKSDLEDHMKTHHDTSSKDLQISCYICQKTFLLRSNLWRHLRNIHNLETGGNIKKKEFTCNTCDKKFYYKNDLTEHMEVHNTEKKYKCDTCQRTFLSKARATRHAKECEQEFICQLCGKQLSSSAKLRAHALTHSDDRPFKCVFCECKFKEKRSLINHVKKKHEKDDIEEGKTTENENIDDHKSNRVEECVSETQTSDQDVEEFETVQNTDDNNTHNVTKDAQNVQQI